jgi:pimeloyl-ACP methyl ester carboxylesterase
MSRFVFSIIIACFLFVGDDVYSGEAQYDPVSMDPPNPDPVYPPVLHELLIPSHDVMLSGIMLGANGAGPHPTVLLLHGFPGNEKNLDLAQSLRRAGYNVLFFHYRGAWGSQGDYTVGGQTGDVEAVLDYVRENADRFRADTKQLSVIGHSLGGFTALRAAAQIKELNCAVGLAAYNFEPEASYTEEQINGRNSYVDQLFMLHNMTGAKLSSEAAENTEAFDTRKLAPKLSGKSVLLIAASEDKAVPPELQSRVVAAYEKNPDINLKAEVIPGDHSFSISRIRLQRMVIDWMNDNCR